MGKIEQIKKAIENAEKLESKLDEGVLAIGGYTGLKLRHLLNNLGAISTNVWEIGSHRGSTICATMRNNDNLKNVFFSDDFSEFNEDGTVRGELIANTKEFCPAKTSLTFLEKDCFTTTKEDISVPIDLYLYDGEHSIESQRNAFAKLVDFMDDEFIAVIDDYNWKNTADGTSFGIRDAKLTVLFSSHIGSERDSDGANYWNGTRVVLLKKSK